MSTITEERPDTLIPSAPVKQPSVENFEWPTIDLSDSDGELDQRAHIVRRRSPEIGAEQVVQEAIESGTEVEALCGYRWVPTLHPKAEMPVCKACMERFANGAV